MKFDGGRESNALAISLQQSLLILEGGGGCTAGGDVGLLSVTKHNNFS